MFACTVKGKGSGKVPAFLGTKAQDFGAFGAFWALGPPVGAQPHVPIGLFNRQSLQGPGRTQTKSPTVVTGTDCKDKEGEKTQSIIILSRGEEV